MSRNAWIIFGVVCLILFGGLVVWSGRDRVDVSNVDSSKIQPATEGSGNIADQVFGNKDAKVVLVEYGDFQCPGCGSAHPNIKNLSEKYKDDMAFVFRNYPLVDRHPNARAAAAAVEAAGILGKYWEMHNIMFERQQEWSEVSGSERGDLFASYAEEAGLAKDKFNATLTERSSDINKKINFDQSLGRKKQVNGTPTFYLNDKIVDQYVLNGKIVPSSTSDASPIWGDEESLDKLILQPAFKDAGVTLDNN